MTSLELNVAELAAPPGAEDISTVNTGPKRLLAESACNSG
jgi:hypothetical protein